jgi:uncharacterized protein (DUF983 family)
MPHRSNGFRRPTAVVQQRCPRCLQGQVFATLFRMHEQCPVCGLRFEREPGYFTGAMYLSYGVAIIVTSPMWLIIAWLGRSLGEVLLVIVPLLVLGCPGSLVMRAYCACTSTKHLPPASSKASPEGGPVCG